MDSNTIMYSAKEFDQVLVEEVLKDVFSALKEKGYSPINQIAGYLMSGDPGYISSYKDARKKITSIERSKILEYLLNRNFGEEN